MTSLYYVEFIGDQGEPEAVTILSPSSSAVREAIGPRTITRILRLPNGRREPFEPSGIMNEEETWTAW